MDETTEVLFAYTRQQAIADGVLIDVSQLAREAGFRFPVALSAAAWNDCLVVPVDDPTQDETGRIWDVLNVLRYTVLLHRRGQQLSFTFYLQNGDVGRLVELKAVCGPGDEGEPVITIMLPHED